MKLDVLLENEVHGIQSVTTLMYKNPLDTLESLILSKYEVLNTEPLHNISNHIKNLYQETLHHVLKKKKKHIRQILDVSFNGKDTKNSSDYRKTLLTVNKWFSDNQHTFLTKFCFQYVTYKESSIIKNKEEILELFCNYTQLHYNMH